MFATSSGSLTPAEKGRFVLECQRKPWLYAKAMFGAELSDQQMLYFRALASPNARISVRSGISTGKTTANALACHWHVDCFPHSKGAATAPTKPQLRDALVAEVRLWQEKKNPQLVDEVFGRTEVTTDQIYAVDRPDSFVVFKTASKDKPEALQGLHADYILAIVDEAAGVADAVFDPLRGATGKYATRIVYTANPNRASGTFHRSQTHSAFADWTRLAWSSWDSPLSQKDYLQELKDAYGAQSDMYRIRVLGQFPSASPCQLIPTDLVEEACKRHLRPEQYNFAPKILGVDVAWEGDDRSVIYLRQGLYSKKLFVARNMSSMDLAERVAMFEDDLGVDATFVDVGWGTGVIDRLRQLGRRPIPVHFGGSALDDAQYRNKRAEMWFRMLAWLVEGGTIEDDEELKVDLTAPEYGPDDTKKTLERKKDIKKRLGISTDLGDGLALTFAQPVVARRDEYSSFSTPVLVEMDYDMFSREHM